MTTLEDFLRAVLDEDERVARKAGDERAPDGESWQWVHQGDPQHRPGQGLVDRPVDLDRWVNDDDIIGINGPDFADRVYLASAEDYPTQSVGPLPHFVVHTSDQVSVAGARHIARHDPQSVLARIDGERALLALYEHKATAMEKYPNPVNMGGFGDLQRAVRALAWGYRHRDGWQSEWAPGEGT